MRVMLACAICLVLAICPPVLAAAGDGPVLVAVGDLNFDDGLGTMILRQGPDYPWRDTIEILRDGDLLCGNLEVPLSLRGAVWIKKTYLLHADPRTAEALTAAGFDLVSLANNHMMDFGAPALLETLSILDERGIAHAGAGSNLAAARAPALVDLGSLRLAMLSYCRVYPKEFRAGENKPGTAWCTDQEILADVAAAKAQADVVAVSIHWGADYVPTVSAAQRALARACIDRGAAVIIGHHPHILNGLEIYGGGLIAYSLGNFAFGSLNKKANDSAILRIGFSERGMPLWARLYPVNVNNYEVNFQTKRRRGPDAERVLQDLRRLSAPFGTRIVSENGVGLIEFAGE